LLLSADPRISLTDRHIHTNLLQVTGEHVCVNIANTGAS
jgi:hypothetical protein